MQLRYLRALIPTLCFALLTFVLCACDKTERDNPWDDKANLDPASWAPQNLQAERTNVTSVKLSWEYADLNIEGFKLDRKKGEEQWQIDHRVIKSDARNWIDEDAAPGPNYSYKLYAFAGQNKSAEIIASIDTEIPAPQNFKINVISSSSITLTWEYEQTIHKGFKIDRKINQDDWQVAFAALDPNRNSYTDQSVNMNYNSYTYRIYAHIDQFNSEKIEGYVSQPRLTTAVITGITQTTATGGGEVTYTGSSQVTARGIAYSTSTNPTISNLTVPAGSGTGSFTANMAGLTPNTTYYVRAYATNSAGTAYGNQVSFTSGVSLPEVTTSPVTNITHNSARGGGNVTNDGGATVTARGIAYSTSTNPTISDLTVPAGSGTGSFTANMSGLDPNTTYYVRAYATNSAGTAYGNQVSFKTDFICGANISDIDGNIYGTVLIGNQCWLNENLKTSRYSDGTQILTGLNEAQWANTSLGAYAIYSYDSVTGLNSNHQVFNAYGVLYNWYSVATGKLCPTGWRVPNNDEWAVMINYLINEHGLHNERENTSIYGTGNALKSCRQVNSPLGGTCNTSTHPRWESHHNHYGTDNFGFSAVPGGRRHPEGFFYTLGLNSLWWSTSQYSSTEAWGRYIFYDYGNTYLYFFNKRYGFSVRCIKE